MFEVEKDFGFEAAHHFEGSDAGEHQRIHGHSFRGTVTIQGDPRDETGWVRDLWKIDKIIAEETGVLDHAVLNDIPGLERPAMEQIAKWVYDRLKPRLPGLTCVQIARPTLGERARYTGG